MISFAKNLSCIISLVGHYLFISKRGSSHQHLPHGWIGGHHLLALGEVLGLVAKAGGGILLEEAGEERRDQGVEDDLSTAAEEVSESRTRFMA